MNTLEKRFIQLILPAIVNYALSQINTENIFRIKKEIYEAGKRVTEKIPGTLDDKLWEYTAGLMLFEGAFKDREYKFIEWLEDYSLIVKDETFRIILQSIATHLKTVIAETKVIEDN